jgi:serine/threonine protein kinase
MSDPKRWRMTEERMSSSLQGKADAKLRLVSEQEAAAVPENARPTDDSPTVISKTPPIVEPAGSSTQDKIVDLARKSSPESIVASLRGRHLAHYELIEPIGVGGMAAVIRARDTQLDRFVALKILPPEMSHEPENVKRFHQEAKAAAKLDHENIARVFYCGEDQGLHFIAFEYVEGINLRTMLEQRGRVPVPEAVRYILQVATGLEHAATRGVVHRDVKPSNIIVTPTGRAKLVDMGLARNLERRGEVDLTQSGMTLGTFDYISPEQALEPREADMRSDIYSLGCTLYHLLTGQTPVPEGTPAKKLYHHQHLAPTDPRQIDPAIPDEIVMILSKMMAKSPKDRYQRPIHLVHHLMQVAQKVGAADDLAEGVLFVDTPLPGHPRSRPFLFIGMALAALVAVTMLLTLLVPETQTNKGKFSEVAKTDAPDSKGNPKGITSTPPETSPAKRPDVVNSLADLRAVVADAGGQDIKARIDASGVIELDGLVFKGNQDRRLELESDHAENNILHFQYQSSATPFGLLVEGGEEVVFRKIKFQIDSKTTPNQAAVAALALRGVKRVTFEKCIFAQADVPMIPTTAGVNRVPLASLLIDVGENPEHAQPVVILNDCYFDSNKENGGQVAIAINGAALVTVTNTAFRPHSAMFSFRNNCTRAGTMLNLQNCTGFVVTGPAFRVAEKAAAKVHASNSVFARPIKGVAGAGLAQPGLIFLAGDKSAILYEGRHNLCYALNDFVESKAGFPIVTLDGFKKFLSENGGSDVDSKYPDSARNPMAHGNPLSLADDLAFQLKDEYANGAFGLQRTWLGKPMPSVAAAPPAKAMPKKLIVDPDNDRRLQDVEFEKVAEALLRAKDGDVIEIKHGKEREVEVLPVPLKAGRVTLKAHEDFQPILVLDKAYKQEKDAALFKLQEGKLQFEQLEFLLDPGPAEFNSQSVVHLGEAGHCIFKQCVISLRSEKIQLSAVTFLDLERMMKMDSPAPPAGRVEFHECFVRGKGDLVSLRGCRLLHVDMKNSLVALDGSLLDVTASDKAMAMEQGVRWKMEHTSVFTTDSIFALRSMTGVGLTKTEADIRGCLFVSLLPERPVVLLDMKNNSELNKYLDWRGEQNFYANFDKDKVTEWKDLFRETKDFGKLGLPRLSDENRQPLWDAELDWFTPGEQDEQMRIRNFGLPDDAKKTLMQLLNADDPSS